MEISKPRPTPNSPVHPDEIGRLFVMSYSGGILIDEGLIQNKIVFGGYDYYLEPPARIALPTWRPIPQITSESFKALFPTATVPPIMRLAAIPTVSDVGLPGIQQVWADTPVPTGLPKDTLVIIAFGNSPGHSATPLGPMISMLFRWIRVISGQWWAGRPTEYLTGNTHLEVGIFPPNEIRGHPIPTAKATYAQEFRRISCEDWNTICKSVENGDDLDQYKEFLLDCFYNYFTNDYLNFFIRICSFLEINVSEWMSREKITSNAMKVGENDIIKKISVGFKNIGKQSLDDPNFPGAFEFIKSCWIARGNIAHGKPLIWIYRGNRSTFSDHSPSEIFKSIEGIINWTKLLS